MPEAAYAPIGRDAKDRDVVRLRHPEWQEHQLRWRWLYDSFEGGDRYRQAVYGYDYANMPLRNLVRHKREYPPPRQTASNYAYGDQQAQPLEDGDYAMRLARTPVPTFVAEAVESFCCRIFGKDVKRDAPETSAFRPLREWWDDVDGKGTTLSEYMREVVAPLLLTLGQLDLCFDHPKAPDGASIASQADVAAYGLDGCVVSHVLPENVVWWRLDANDRRYEAVLICEPYEDEKTGRQEERYRYWDDAEMVLYEGDGTVVERRPHAFGVVPVVRVFDRRKLRCRHVGQPRLEAVAEHQREYYNRDSELVLSDTTQAHPLFQGPEDYVQADGTVPIGPSWLLPKKKSTLGTTVAYEGFEVVDFPKGGAESIRANKRDIRDFVDRIASLTKPAGSAGRDAGGTSVAAQSGLSKAFDHEEKHAALKAFAKTMAKVERAMAETAMAVLTDGAAPDMAPVVITYPSTFSLMTADDLAKQFLDFQAMLAAAGKLPEIDEDVLETYVRTMLPGLDDAEYAVYDREIELAVRTAVSDAALAREGAASTPMGRTARITFDDPEKAPAE